MTSFRETSIMRRFTPFVRRLTLLSMIAAAVILAVTGAAPRTTPMSQSPQKTLEGFVDMHTHPMSNLAFGGKLIHGAPDVLALIPTDAHCRNGLRALNWQHALEDNRSTHAGWGLDNPCGDYIRQQVIRKFQSENGAYVCPDGARGAPDFAHWPRWNDITHQKMFVEWIKRAHWGGLRVMVALATHNESLAAAVMGPGDELPKDDRASADLQIREIKTLVQRHGDFMEIALTAADLRRIVGAGKLAVVLGVEIDNIGNFHRLPPGAVTPVIVRGELQRLHNPGVRYIFPTHVVDNLFAGTAVYEANFNLSNRHLTGRFWSLECSEPDDSIYYRYQRAGFDLGFEFVKVTKLELAPGDNPPPPPSCSRGQGHVNSRGLSPLGEFALREMMKLGMLIDFDHMSQKAVNHALDIAESVDGGYPLNSGHNGPRAKAQGQGRNEKTRTYAQMRRIASLGGMFGVGTAGVNALDFIQNYRAVASRMRYQGVGIGTDLNGLEKGIKPRSGAIRYDASFPHSRLGAKAWNYNTDGVAHYGLLADFIRDLRGVSGETEVVNTLFQSAEHFARMWEKAERQKSRIPIE